MCKMGEEGGGGGGGLRYLQGRGIFHQLEGWS